YHAPWHGFGEVVALANATVGQLEIHVVGGDVKEMSGLPDNLISHGFLDGAAYRNVFSSCDVGLGSCGLHRIPLKEACPLKMRDYLAAGLAVIVPYEDTALEEKREGDGEYPEWMLKVPNGPENLVGARESILEFCRSWVGRRVPRSEVEPLIDVVALEARRVSFFKSVCEGVGSKVMS
ncbi:MAG: hypothetical protein P8J87_07345, partial [Verrucomicrobiales bacterium]|nr:hypothetical protein [Verrucomicrobiales bacterium]